jgi:soluble lytic murein transglycosylase
MRVENSQNVSSRAPRWLSGSLAVLMALSPVTGMTADTPTVSAATHKKTTSSAKRRSHGHKGSQAARTARIHQAFVASAELRPMAQQLATLRTPAAYEGVTHYAQTHSGEAAGAAYLALGHAYLLDKRYTEAAENMRLGRKAGQELADYDDFLGAQADHEAGNEQAAEALLHGFTERYPDSIFNRAADAEQRSGGRAGAGGAP